MFAGFTVVRHLGTGGMGGLYLATEPRTMRSHALRVLPASMSSDQQFRARFQRRADQAAALRHPHVVGVHDHGHYQGLLWLAMDFVDGTDAATLMRGHYPGGMAAELAFDVVAAVADGLDYAHGRRTTHGDVTAANILLASDGSGRILLTGFDLPLTHDAGPSADQPSLATAARHLLTGRHDASSVPAITRALDADPRRRFDTCTDFALALRETATAPTRARPVIDPAAEAPTTYVESPQTAAAPYVPIPAWSAEEPTPETQFEP